MSRIIITDVHGCYKTLMALIAQLPPGIPITFAGDLIDRGPDSRKVIEFVKNGGYDCVKGNHEDMMVRDLGFDDKGTPSVNYYHSDWTFNGGMKLLRNYENTPEDDALLKEHHDWLAKLPIYLEYPELKNEAGMYLLVTHSTASEVWHRRHLTNLDDRKQFEARIMWDRISFPAKIPNIYNCYGHTPQKHGPTIKEYFACLDTGCYMNRPEYGRLTALQFPEMLVYTQMNVEEERPEKP